ncbi:MAG: hypothetical protein ACI9HK_005574 [Pirellulaceae bacterium]
MSRKTIILARILYREPVEDNSLGSRIAPPDNMVNAIVVNAIVVIAIVVIAIVGRRADIGRMACARSETTASRNNSGLKQQAEAKRIPPADLLYSLDLQASRLADASQSEVAHFQFIRVLAEDDIGEIL